jgi:hypothetical protein
MTLDFYAGALMHIDSAEVLGFKYWMSLHGLQETSKNTSAIASLPKTILTRVDVSLGLLSIK